MSLLHRWPIETGNSESNLTQHCLTVSTHTTLAHCPWRRISIPLEWTPQPFASAGPLEPSRSPRQRHAEAGHPPHTYAAFIDSCHQGLEVRLCGGADWERKQNKRWLGAITALDANQMNIHYNLIFICLRLCSKPVPAPATSHENSAAPKTA